MINKTKIIKLKFKIKENLVYLVLNWINLASIGNFLSNLNFSINMFPNNILIIVKRANNINKTPLICIIALISNVLFRLNNLLLNKSFKSKLDIIYYYHFLN
jgi:hypothetical protein